MAILAAEYTGTGSRYIEFFILTIQLVLSLITNKDFLQEKRGYLLLFLYKKKEEFVIAAKEEKRWQGGEFGNTIPLTLDEPRS
jgi:hypothetical protein